MPEQYKSNLCPVSLMVRRDQCSTYTLPESAFIDQSNISGKLMCSPCLLSQRLPRTRSKDVFPVPVFPVISRLFPCVTFRFRSLMSSFSEEGAERETCSRRKAVSLEHICSSESLKSLKRVKGRVS